MAGTATVRCTAGTVRRAAFAALAAAALLLEAPPAPYVDYFAGLVKLNAKLAHPRVGAHLEVRFGNREAFVKASASVYELFAKEVPAGRGLIDDTLALAKKPGC